MATANIPPPSDDNLILVCGPPPMYKALSGDKAKDKSQGDPIWLYLQSMATIIEMSSASIKAGLLMQCLYI